MWVEGMIHQVLNSWMTEKRIKIPAMMRFRWPVSMRKADSRSNFDMIVVMSSSASRST